MRITATTYCHTAVSSLFTAQHTLAEKHAFSAKERDTETGLSYFGARYYSSDLSIWLAMDPMVDKYPSLSPYVYCADNPVKLVDPNGEEWLVNESGYIKNGGDCNDKNIYSVKGTADDEFGDRQKGSRENEIAIYIGDEMNNGREENNNIHYRNREGKLEEYSYASFSISNKTVARKVFILASKYTNVEWSFYGDEKGNHLSNSHKVDTDIHGGNQALKSANRGTLSFYFHNHPRVENLGMFSNTRDRNRRNACLDKSLSAIIGIMHRGLLYDLDANKIDWNGTKR